MSFKFLTFEILVENVQALEILTVGTPVMQDILILNNLSFILILILNVIHVAKGAHWFSNKYIFINYLMVMDRNSAMIAILDDSIVNVPNLHSQFKFHFTFIEDCQILVIVCEIFVRFLAFSNGL